MVYYKSVIGDCSQRMEEKRKDPKIIRSLASKIFNIKSKDVCFDPKMNPNHLFLTDDAGFTIARIDLKFGAIELTDPLYVEEADRFANVYEKAFLSGGGEVTISRKYCINRE